jgi:hypothetical protein
MNIHSCQDHTSLHLDRSCTSVIGGNVYDGYPPPQHRQDQLRLMPTHQLELTSNWAVGDTYQEALLLYSSLLSSSIHPIFKLKKLKKVLSEFISLHIASPMTLVDYSY